MGAMTNQDQWWVHDTGLIRSSVSERATIVSAVRFAAVSRAARNRPQASVPTTRTTQSTAVR